MHTRLLMRMLLEMNGCRVVEAVNGKEAVELARTVHPNLILMDLNLPVLDGYEATRQIQAHPQTSDIPVLAFSAQCCGDSQQQALAAGCLECIQKPVDFAVIDDVLGRYLAT